MAKSNNEKSRNLRLFFCSWVALGGATSRDATKFPVEFLTAAAFLPPSFCKPLCNRSHLPADRAAQVHDTPGNTNRPISGCPECDVRGRYGVECCRKGNDRRIATMAHCCRYRRRGDRVLASLSLSSCCDLATVFRGPQTGQGIEKILERDFTPRPVLASF